MNLKESLSTCWLLGLCPVLYLTQYAIVHSYLWIAAEFLAVFFFDLLEGFNVINLKDSFSTCWLLGLCSGSYVWLWKFYLWVAAESLQVGSFWTCQSWRFRLVLTWGIGHSGGWCRNFKTKLPHTSTMSANVNKLCAGAIWKKIEDKILKTVAAEEYLNKLLLFLFMYFFPLRKCWKKIFKWC